jgi:hypothetical protein
MLFWFRDRIIQRLMARIEELEIEMQQLRIEVRFYAFKNSIHDCITISSMFTFAKSIISANELYF